jgi:hypothetical protein
VDLTGKTVMLGIVDAHGHPGFLDAFLGDMSKANSRAKTTSTICSAKPITALSR